MVSRITRALIDEGFDATRRAVGTVPFKKSALIDPHIKAIIESVHRQFHIPVADLEAKVGEQLIKLQKFQKYSPILYDEAVKNAIESGAFELVEKVATDSEYSSKRVIFNDKIFNQLIKLVQQDHSQFKKIRNPYKLRAIRTISPIILPDSNPAYAKFKGITTACATGDGEFVFYEPFMQKLLDFAMLDNLKPKGPKYQHNGGPIPDAYGYIEFLIMHELLHYTYGDMHVWAKYGEYKQYSHQVLNWASDFRINYQLVKNGYSQLPIGLYSDHINFDRQHSFKKMCDIVQEELDKIPPEERTGPGGIEEVMGPLDDHEAEEGEPGIPVDQDEVTKDTEEKMGDQEVPDEGKPGDENKPGEPGDQDPSKKTDKEGSKTGDMQKVDKKRQLEQLKPILNWRRLIKLMLSDSAQITGTTYAKPSRKTVSALPTAIQTGAMAIKPAERPTEQPVLKVLLLLDTSGSMWHVMKTVLSETKNAMRALNRENSTISLCFFAGSAEFYKINFAQDKWEKTSNMSDLNKPMSKNAKKGIDDILTIGRTGGTEFTPAVYADVSSLMGSGWNVVLFSDNNMLWEENWPNLVQLTIKHKNQFFFICDTLDTWRRCVAKLGSEPKRWSVLKDN